MHENCSLADLVRALPASQREKALKDLYGKHYDPEKINYDWQFWARPNQMPPAGDWRTWLLKAGRGFGKTRTGAEYVRMQIDAGKSRRVALVGPTAADARDVMVEGESGLLAICPPWNSPKYEPSKRRLTWPNGIIATTYSADEPDRLRGPQHDLAWADELAAWKYPESWDMLMFGLRLGNNPRCIVTTTPRPSKIIKDLVKDITTITTNGTSYENKANLAQAFFSQIIKKYENTRLGRQEINGEILEDNPAALWKASDIDALRVSVAPEMRRIVVAIDPAVTDNEDSDETGIIVAGLGIDDHGYVLADLSLSDSPDTWARAAISAYHRFMADRIVAEVNNGGDLVEAVIRTIGTDVSYRAVRASRGKVVRAEPIAAIYEQGRIHHVGMFPKLEDQMCEYDPATATISPDRMDALVWAFTDLMGGGPGKLFGGFTVA